MATPWWAYPIEQGFKWTRSNVAAHSGIDIAAPFGTLVTAVLPGKIIGASFHPWGGQVDELVTIAGHSFVLSWLHLSQIGVRIGERVTTGESLGKSGTPPPGYGKGPHIHFEVTNGTVAPYTTYNPQHPTGTSYPVNPLNVLGYLFGGSGDNSSSGQGEQVAGNNNNGNNAASGAFAQGFFAGLGGALDPIFAAGAGSALQQVNDIPGAIGAAVGALIQGGAQLAKRGAFLVLALSIILLGIWLLVEPEVKQAAGQAAKAAEMGAMV